MVLKYADCIYTEHHFIFFLLAFGVKYDEEIIIKNQKGNQILITRPLL